MGTMGSDPKFAPVVKVSDKDDTKATLERKLARRPSQDEVADLGILREPSSRSSVMLTDKMINQLGDALTVHTEENRERLKSQGILREVSEAAVVVDEQHVTKLSNMLSSRSLEDRDRLKSEGKLREQGESSGVVLDDKQINRLSVMVQEHTAEHRDRLKSEGKLYEENERKKTLTEEHFGAMTKMLSERSEGRLDELKSRGIIQER